MKPRTNSLLTPLAGEVKRRGDYTLHSALCTLHSAICNLPSAIVLSLFFVLTPCRAQTVVPSSPPVYTGRYILASLVLPGSGQYLMGSKARGEAYLWTDAAIWLTYGGMTAVGNLRNQSAKLYARQYSGASLTQPTDDYYVALERYATSDDYNTDIRRDARELYPDDPQAQKAYLQSHGYFGDQTWAWDSDSSRYAYWHMRMGERSVLHTAGFVLGAALLNRVVSAVDAAFFTKSDGHAAIGGAQPSDHFSLADRLGAEPTLDRPGLTLQYRF